MWKQILLIAVLLSIIVSASADTVLAENYYAQDSASSSSGTQVDADAAGADDNVQDNSSYPKISQIENKLYSKSYASEDIYKRLDRLEATLYHQNFSSNDLATRVDKIVDKAQYSAMPGYLLTDIATLEKNNFNKIFKSDNPDARLERLEYHLIGAVQDGNYKDRVYKLKSLNSENYVTKYLDDNSYAYTEDYTPIEGHSVDKVRSSGLSANLKNVLFMVAPFLFGLL